MDLTELKYLREDFEIPTDRKVKKNSIFICMSNGSKQHVGKVAFIEDDLDYAFGGFMGLIIPRKEVSPKYVFYSCQSSAYRLFLSGIGNGIGITNLRFTDLANYSIPLPPVQEQEKIVAELDCLSSIIEKKKQQLKELDNLAQSIFHDMFGDPITNEKGWELKKLGDVCCRIFAGGDVPKKACSSTCTDTYSIPIISNGLENDGLYGFTDKAREKEKCITIAGRGVNVGIPILRKKPFFPIIRLNVIVPDTTILIPEFLLYFFKAKKVSGNGGAIPQLTVPMLTSQAVSLPSLDLQNAFARKIEAIEKQKELIKKSIEETETLFNSRMDYWFN